MEPEWYRERRALIWWLFRYEDIAPAAAVEGLAFDQPTRASARAPLMATSTLALIEPGTERALLIRYDPEAEAVWAYKRDEAGKWSDAETEGRGPHAFGRRRERPRSWSVLYWTYVASTIQAQEKVCRFLPGS